MPPEKLDPGDDDRRTPDHRIERLQSLLPAEPRDPLDQDLQIGLDRPEIDVLGITSRHQGMVIDWHEIDPARSWLTVGYDEGRWSKALPVNGNQSLGVTNSLPLGSGHHHVGMMASAYRTDEAL